MKPEQKPWKERAWELLQEQASERLRPAERVRERLHWEDWPGLGREAERFAEMELKRRHGALGEVLPGGYDAKSIAAQAVADVLEGKSRLAAGVTRLRIQQELERLIRGKLRLLTSLKEASATRSEWEVERPDAKGEPSSVLKRVGSACADGYEAAVEREEAERQARVKGEFEQFLAEEPELLRLFGCLWNGMTNPGAIGQKLGLEESAVAAARKRLERRMIQFGRKR